jgi:Tol biopolymer transport system component
MKRLLLLLILVTFSNSCKDKAIDPSKRVRPVSLKIITNGANYDLSWEEIRIVCITTPCPDIADVEAEQYEIQVADNELGPFQTYKTIDARQKSISIPVAGQGEQLVARIVSKAEGAPPANSNPVMATKGFLSQSAYYPGFGSSGELTGGDVTPDGKKATYFSLTEEAPGQYISQLHVAEMEYERIVSTKIVTRQGRTPKFSKDGLQLAYSSETENGLIIYDIASGRKQTLPVTNAGKIQGLDWSPDGKWLAFCTSSDEDSRLWKIAVSGGTPTPLTPPLSIRGSKYIRQADIDWSPDGQAIAVSTAQTENTDKQWRTVISFYSPEGNGEMKYFETQPGWVDTNPAFSPDGKQLAFLSTRTDPSAMSYSLWVRDLTTGKARRIELLPGIIPSNDYVPHWQGNERLLFMATQQGKRGYFTVFL